MNDADVFEIKCMLERIPVQDVLRVIARTLLSDKNVYRVYREIVACELNGLASVLEEQERTHDNKSGN